MVRRRHNAALLFAALMTLSMSACTSMPSQPSAGQAIDDGIVTAKVKQKLVEDPVTKPHQITVETFKGNVQLSGFVETDQARIRALQLARDTKGVKQVKDAMEVRKEQS
jgi:osmotically-inducible protein OsmY